MKAFVLIFGILYLLYGVVCSIFIDEIKGISYLLFGIGLLIAWAI